MHVLVSEPPLELLVRAGGLGLRAERIAEGELLAPGLRPRHDEVQMMRAVLGRGLAEPVHQLDLVREPPVGQRPQRLDRVAALLEAPHLGQDVDHRLGAEARHARAADVVDLAGEPRREHRLEPRLLRLELGRPGRVVRLDPD